MAGTKATGETKAKAADSKGKATGAARGGISAPVTPSAELAEIVGKDALPRSEVVSKMWVYIKKNDLQNPADKREIMADDKLEKFSRRKKSRCSR